MSPRPLFAFASLFFIAGACVLILLVLLAGAVDRNPANQIFFLQADLASTSQRWTLWNQCDVSPDGLNTNCGPVQAAFPFNAPSGSNSYYYMSRFLFAFVLIALFFSVCSLLVGLLALCSRIGSFLSSISCSIALFFQTIVAALMTAEYVQGRNEFIAGGQNATLGKLAFGFFWAAMACLFLATVLFCLAGATSRKEPKARQSGGRSFFGRKKTARSRGSFIDSERQRQVTKEFA